MQNRSRPMNAAQFGGQPCQGASTENQNCNTQTCRALSYVSSQLSHSPRDSNTHVNPNPIQPDPNPNPNLNLFLTVFFQLLIARGTLGAIGARAL